jgi:hypothetical protein
MMTFANIFGRFDHHLKWLRFVKPGRECQQMTTFANKFARFTGHR